MLSLTNFGIAMKLAFSLSLYTPVGIKPVLIIDGKYYAFEGNRKHRLTHNNCNIMRDGEYIARQK